MLSGALSGSPVQAGPDFDQYVASLKEQALAAGMLPETVSAALRMSTLSMPPSGTTKISRNSN